MFYFSMLIFDTLNFQFAKTIVLGMASVITSQNVVCVMPSGCKTSFYSMSWMGRAIVVCTLILFMSLFCVFGCVIKFNQFIFRTKIMNNNLIIITCKTFTVVVNVMNREHRTNYNTTKCRILTDQTERKKRKKIHSISVIFDNKFVLSKCWPCLSLCYNCRLECFVLHHCTFSTGCGPGCYSMGSYLLDQKTEVRFKSIYKSRYNPYKVCFIKTFAWQIWKVKW